MKVKVKITGIIRQDTGWKDAIEVEGSTPMECLDNLFQQYPNSKKWVYNKKGEMWERFQIFVNDQQIHNNAFSSSLNEGDELTIMLNICGG